MLSYYRISKIYNVNNSKDYSLGSADALFGYAEAVGSKGSRHEDKQVGKTLGVDIHR